MRKRDYVKSMIFLYDLEATDLNSILTSGNSTSWKYQRSGNSSLNSSWGGGILKQVCEEQLYTEDLSFVASARDVSQVLNIRHHVPAGVVA